LNSGEAARQIFIDELTALLKLKHPNIVEMYDYGIDGKIVGENVRMEGVWFIVLEYISERTMIDLIKQQGCMTEEVACFYFSQMIDVLIYIKS
jgi:serine/threonine protein kinase